MEAADKGRVSLQGEQHHHDGEGDAAHTNQHVQHMEVHRDNVADGTNEVGLHTVEGKHSEVRAQAQEDFQHEEASQGDLETNRIGIRTGGRRTHGTADRFSVVSDCDVAHGGFLFQVGKDMHYPVREKRENGIYEEENEKVSVHL